MGRTKKVGPAGRFGARYGVRIRKRVAEIEMVMRQWHKCPRCGIRRVKRIGTALWRCRKCGYTFTGGAYFPMTAVGKTVRQTIATIQRKEQER
ncbi:MAG: 50S ribosomal protein L37ae [Candidatus Baldrarchaeia archaeon]